MYTEKYISNEIIESFEKSIKEKGFIGDVFLSSDPDVTCLGLNVTIEWPFPETLRKKYRDFISRFEKYNKHIYFYPFENTHITLVTILNFKNHLQVSNEDRIIIDKIKITIVKSFFNLSSFLKGNGIGAFEIELGPPVLSSAAGIFPIINRTNEISIIRRKVNEILESLQIPLIACEVNTPPIIHSTFLRYNESINDFSDFQGEFEENAVLFEPEKILVKKILLTLETKPYMRDGKILHRLDLEEKE